ncbi:MAG: TIGR00282 family metallophosphoesterase [Oscillospiraceae bacterium]|nr:TIGR00282 family metallophosphoesterase [Oscillospiraceae bacterium]MBQ9981970.1 TIGR00282 family metallophosphoesterase [Oscillospiraceae bacterium]
MNLLFIGDVVGKSGCEFLKNNLYKIKKEHTIDITIANGENSAPGNGITKSSASELISCGVDIVTTGNHAFRRKEIGDIFDKENIIRPANYPDGCIGHGFGIFDYGRYRLAVINLMGTAFMEALDNPFSVVDDILAKIDTPNIIVDFHAEATAEKKALGHYLAGRVTAVLGTHTHVQTADETILLKHTGYITDVGMTGPEDSVLGVTSEDAVKKQRFKTPVFFTESQNPSFLNAVILEIDVKLGICTKIKRLILR